MSVLDRLNDIRRRAGLTVLTPNAQLAQAAQGHAVDLASGRVNLNDSHRGSDGSSVVDRVRRVGYPNVPVLEMTGWGWGGDEAQQVAYWMGSPVHYPIIHNAHMTEAGVGYAYVPGSLWGHYWVVDLGQRPNVPPPPGPPDLPPPRPPFSSYVPIVTGGPKTPQIDMLNYLRGDGRAYMVQHPGGGSEKFRTVRDGARFLQLKNSQWEEFWFTDDFIWRGVDTSPGDGQYYRQFEDGQEGARWCPRWMTVGQQWESPAEHTVQTYWKGNCAPVDHHRNGRTRNRLTLRARHVAMRWNGVTVEDVIEVGSHTGESMFFGCGYGLAAWSSTWGSSAIAQLLPAAEADNVPEGGCFGEW